MPSDHLYAGQYPGFNARVMRGVTILSGKLGNQNEAVQARYVKCSTSQLGEFTLYS
jgi:hypothetical protein